MDTSAITLRLETMSTFWSMAGSFSKCAYPIDISKFLDFSEILENGDKPGKRRREANWGIPVSPLSLSLLLKPEGNSTANRTTARTELGNGFCVLSVCLEVQ